MTLLAGRIAPKTSARLGEFYLGLLVVAFE
jgi:hypothetical protein